MAQTEGEVLYELRGDDSHLEGDLDAAQAKVEQSTKKTAERVEKIEKEKTESVKKQQEEVTDHHKQEKAKQEKTEEKAAKTFKEAAKDIGTDLKEQMDKVETKTAEVFDAIRHPVKSTTAFVGDKAKDIKESFATSFEETNQKAISGMEKVATAILHPVEAAKTAGAGIKEHLGSAMSTVGDVASGIATAMGTGMLAVGTAAAGVGVAAITSADDMSQAMNQFMASTGKGAEEAERYQNVLENIYANNYGEDFQDIADSMAQVTKNMGDMDDSSLQEVTESAFALRDTFEYDISESTRAAKAMMDSFGASGKDAMNLIASGAQNGLDYSGEMLDSISEYSVQFAKMGLDADDMFKIFEKGAEAGAWNLDKIGDAVKEMSIRVIDGSETTAEGFASIGLDADKMATKFAAGGESAKEAFNETIAALASMEDPLAQNQAGVALFGTMWEDLGPEVVTQLASIEEGVYDTTDAMESIKETKYDDLGSMFEGLKRSVEMLLLPLGEELLPVLDELIDTVLPVLEEALPPMIEILGAIIEQIAPMIEEILPALLDLLNTLLPAVTVVFSGMASLVQTSIKLVINVLKEVIDFIKNVFTGNWQGAWENVKNIFKAIADSLAEIFKIPINWIIDKINSFIDGLNRIKIPDWVPVVGGKGFNIPRIPKLRVGMDFVPADDFPALLHRGEAVLTAEENAMLRSIGGIGAVYSALNSPSLERSSNVTVENMASSESIDYERLGGAVADALVEGNVRFVVGEREFARLKKELE